jgi:hypothetical protein
MSVKIFLKPSEVWNFYESDIARMKREMVAVATNEETGYAVYLTDSGEGAVLEVHRNDQLVDSAALHDATIAKDIAASIYLEYLYPVTVTSGVAEPCEQEPDEEDTELSEAELEDLIVEREDELLMALSQFLEVAVDGFDYDEALGNGILDEILDGVCEYLTSEWALPVFRPAFVASSSGDKIFVEFSCSDNNSDAG